MPASPAVIDCHTHLMWFPDHLREQKSATMDKVVAGLRTINDIVEGTRLPKIPVEVQDMILFENWKAFFPDLA